jgi:catechol-2,3-dioxygenase
LHIAFSYPTLTALAQQYVFLKTCEKPILPLWTVNHGPTTSMYFRDPDGNKIELQVDNFDDVDEANNFMAGPKYDTNPRL